MKKYKIKPHILILATMILIIISIPLLLWNGVILFNNPSTTEYPVRGVDVSNYQGEIDWDILSKEEGIQFAFIKATEGSSFVDKSFLENFNNATQTDLRVGAYHFFSYDSGGITQAENFIREVPNHTGMLPPVVDVEFYGDKKTNLPIKEDVQRELNLFINLVEEHYGMSPIIYATEKSYELFLENDFAENDIWIRDVYGNPSLSDNREWVFWQYTERDVLKGYNGEEKYIDVNVFNGSQQDFDSYCVLF